MPKAELHLHLDGCLRPVTAIELARQQGIEAPTTFESMFHALVGPAKCASQTELLLRFDLPLQLLQTADALARVTTELVEDKAADGVRFMEVKWAPQFHCKQGLTIGDVIRVVGTAAAEAGARHGVEVRLCVAAVRAEAPEATVALAHAAVANRRYGVTGFDLVGYEAANPDPTPHLPAFEVARAGGLGTCVHAGELPDADLVRRALVLRTDRISHGAPAIDAPDVMAHLAQHGITLDLCPTSNVQADTVATFADHPVVRFLRAGVPVTINTDDITVSDISLSEEWLSCIDVLGLTLPELWACNLHALRVAFVDEPTRARLLAEFSEWATSVPEVIG